jgi:hypothetical protein
MEQLHEQLRDGTGKKMGHDDVELRAPFAKMI